MIYLSKGIVQKNSTEQLLFVAHGGSRHQLTKTEAALWLGGRFGFSVPHTEQEVLCLEHLKRMDLVETEPEDSPVSRYRVLTRCVCCPAVFSRPERPLPHREKTILRWLRQAGLRLTTAELVFLQEHDIAPEEKLLGEKNRQALVKTIYTRDTIADHLLEHSMENAKCRDEVVESLLRLLKKKKIVIL